MARDDNSSDSSRMGRALRLGKRIGKRAASRVLDRAPAERPVPDAQVVVSFERGGRDPVDIEGTAPGGVSLLGAAAQLGIEIAHYCGGQCSCGTCRVEILQGAENLSRQQGLEQMVLGSAHVAAGNRLACQARLLGPVRVRIPEWF